MVAVELDPNAKQKQLEAAITPVADRLLKQFAAAKADFKSAEAEQNEAAAKTAKDTMNALLLFRTDMATYQRVYTFLSQIFDYGNTDFEKRSIFLKYLLRLLKFGREREEVDLSEVVLTHHNLRNKGKQKLNLKDDEYPELSPLGEAGSGEVREAKKACLSEIIEKVNDLFSGDLTENDKLVYINDVIKGKLLESDTLRTQAGSNSKQQFANSPDLNNEIMDAIIDALEAHETMSAQAIDSEEVRTGLKEILLGPARLYEALRDESDEAA